ncbi:Ribosome biogenesis protein erb1 [Entomophthora muscae]|uniref:Ribosome biogenesis protein erb1 n=1 Tax=Entomophthora muscae TaxID=34485 RepID=A0ACC2SKH3_9FUNG|nr:Ribosome biogenesis protein erb1 [Entomophthora muscae]
MAKGRVKQARKYQSSDSEDEIKLSTLNIDAGASDEEGSDLEDGPEMDFPEDNSDDEIPNIRVSDSETLNGKDSESLSGSKTGNVDEEDSDEEYPSSDTELSDEEEDTNSDLEVTSEYVTKKNKKFPERLPEIDPVYDSDSSTEETQNTVGNVPMEWYNDYPHIGYTVDGKKIFKPATKDELDKFLDNADNADAGKTVFDVLEQKDRRLTDEELSIIQRVVSGKMGAEGYDPYPDLVEYFSSKVLQTPLTGGTEPKRRFIPSIAENRKIVALVKAIRRGELVGRRPIEQKPKFYDVWNDPAGKPKFLWYIPAPKQRPPTNAESYNPPEEYLFDEDELKDWKSKDPNERRLDFIPQKYSTLRAVPAYERSYQETFRRCLDLYLNPRVRKNRMDLDPDSLVPKLPDPKDLQPFPTRLSVVFEGHEGKVRTFSVDSSGEYMVSGSDDGTVKVWEVATGRCIQTIVLSGIIYSVAWNPNPSLALIAATTEDQVVLFTPRLLGDEAVLYQTEALIDAGFNSPTALANEANIGSWQKPTAAQKELGIVLTVSHSTTVKQVVWHRKGDYFATVSPKDGGSAIMIHQLSKHQSQRPFRKLKGAIQKVVFHPTQPHFVIATQRFVRVYNLQLQTLEKTLITGSQWVSSLDVHPQGDNIIVGSYDRRLNWFDMDLSSKPYKTLRFHKEAIRAVGFHKRYPLFASCSDDGSLQVFHGMVYNDLMQNPLIVPVKILRGHQITDSLGILHLEFHPHQPWLLSSGSDGKICLFT